MSIAKSLFLMAAACLVCLAGEGSAQSPGKGKHPKPAHALKVLHRHPAPVVTRYPTTSAANVGAKILKRSGWTVRVKAARGGALTVARMPRWKTAGIYANAAYANNAAARARARGMQAKIVPIP